jgi:NRPS condensation-like uncharacterized protein
MQNTLSLKKPTPWEKYMLADDTSDYPMTCHMRFWFEGKWDRNLFEKALLHCLNLHPMLRAILEPQAGNQLWKFLEPDLEHQFSWIHCEQLFSDEHASKLSDWRAQLKPDLRSQFRMIEFLDKSLLIVKFHHAVSDGIGIFEAMEDLLRFYDATTKAYGLEQSYDQIPARHERTEKHVSDYRRSIRERVQSGISQLVRIGNYFGRCPIQVGLPDSMPSEQETDGSRCLGSVVREVCTSQTCRGLIQRGKSDGITMNDQILVVIYRWLSNILSKESPDARIRLAVPINLRSEGIAPLSAQNAVSMVFLDRKLGDCSDRALLLKSVVHEMQNIKRNRLGHAMLNVLGTITKSTRLTKRILSSRLANCTMVVTNLGRPFQKCSLLNEEGTVCAGQMRLIGVDTMPPLRRGTRLAISVNGYAGKLSLSLRFDSKYIDSKRARQILQNLIQLIECESLGVMNEDGAIMPLSSSPLLAPT